VFLGGHSYGGRQTSMLIAEEPGLADGLLLLSYPLHPPRKPGELRTKHFPELRKAAFFVHGTRDPFGTIKEMKAAGIPTFGTDLADPDFTGIARAAGLFGARVEKASELEDALRAAFAHDGPALVDVATARQELSLPPKLTYGQIKGFTLYATRTILSGGGEELVELTKTNLRELEVE